MSYTEPRDYLKLLKDQTGFFDVRVDWSAINPDLVTAFTPGKRMGLQIADAVAGAFHYAVQRRPAEWRLEQPRVFGYTSCRSTS